MQLLHLCKTQISLGRSVWGVVVREGSALLAPRAEHSCTQRVRPASISIPAPSSPNSPAPASIGMNTAPQPTGTTGNTKIPAANRNPYTVIPLVFNLSLPCPGGAGYQNKMKGKADWLEFSLGDYTKGNHSRLGWPECQILNRKLTPSEDFEPVNRQSVTKIYLLLPSSL